MLRSTSDMLRQSPSSSVFHVSIIGENEKITQEGSLEATPTSLVYMEDTSLTKHSWPLRHLRRFETRGDNLFVIEGSKSGDGRYTFSTPHANQINSIVSHNVNLLTQMQPNATPTNIETSPIHWRLNTSVSSDSSSTSVHSRSSSLVKDSVFEVERILPDFKGTEPGTLEITNGDVIYTDSATGKPLCWPSEYLRRYGCEGDVFTVETGRRCLGGPGLYNFKTPRAGELNAAVRLSCGNVGVVFSERNRSTSSSPSPTETRMLTQQTITPSPVTPPNLPPSRRTGPLPPIPPPSIHPPLPPQSHPSPHTTPISSLLSHTPKFTHPLVSPLHITHQQQQRQKLTSGSGSPPPLLKSFKHGDSLRRAFSAMDLHKNVFEVRNLGDDRREVGQGTVEVTGTDLIYIDSKTNEKWKWPFKFLRKYGFEKSIFSFEAGRRCPGGQGLYAFATERANEIHEAIVENIRGHKLTTPSGKTNDHSRSNPRLSLGGDETLTTPPIKLSSRNQYNIDLSTSGGGQRLDSVDGDWTRPAQSLALPLSPPTTTRAASLEGMTDMPNATFNTQFVSGHTPQQAHPQLPPELPRCRLVKPDPSVKPVSEPHHYREHLYDVPSEYALEARRREQNRMKARPYSETDSNASFSSSLGSSEAEEPKLANGVKLPSNTVIGLSSPDTSDQSQSAIVGGKENGKGKPGTAQGVKKDKYSMLSRLMRRNPHNDGVADKEAGSRKNKSAKKSKGKKNGRSHGESVNSRDERNLSEGEEEAEEQNGNWMYENLKDAKLSKKAYSASCDNILESCAMPDSYSTSTPSAVPQPTQALFQRSVSPPTPILPSVPTPSNEMAKESEANPQASFYQNLHIVQADYVTSKATPSLVDLPHPGGGSETPSPLYSNIQLRKTPSPKPMVYTEVSIMAPSQKRRGKVQKQSSLASIPLEPNHTDKTHSFANRKHSQSLILAGTDSDSDHVQYASVDIMATAAVAKIRQERESARNFEEILGRHDVREKEMKK